MKTLEERAQSIMSLFNTEEYYMKFLPAIWTLRSIIIKQIEANTPRGLYYNKQHKHFWIAEFTNNIIGSILLRDYNLYFLGIEPEWCIDKHRDCKRGFFTHDEALRLAKLFDNANMKEHLKQMDEYCSQIEEDDPAYILHELMNDLSIAILDRDRLCA